MDHKQKTINAELKFKILEAVMMLNDDYATNDVTESLLKVVELLENTEPNL